MSVPDASVLENTLIVTSTSEPSFLSGSGPLRWRDLVSSPEVQDVEWIDTPLENDSILEVVKLLEPQLSDRGIERTIVRDYDFYDDWSLIGEIARHAHLVIPVLKAAEHQLQDQGLPTAAGAYLGYKLSKHADREKALALSRMQAALSGRIEEAKAKALALLRESYSADALRRLVYKGYDLDDEGFVFTFTSTTARFRVRVSLRGRNQLSARTVGYMRLGPGGLRQLPTPRTR